jgi:hypothetical protein
MDLALGADSMDQKPVVRISLGSFETTFPNSKQKGFGIMTEIEHTRTVTYEGSFENNVMKSGFQHELHKQTGPQALDMSVNYEVCRSHDKILSSAFKRNGCWWMQGTGPRGRHYVSPYAYHHTQPDIQHMLLSGTLRSQY